MRVLFKGEAGELVLNNIHFIAISPSFNKEEGFFVTIEYALNEEEDLFDKLTNMGLECAHIGYTMNNENTKANNRIICVDLKAYSKNMLCLEGED